MRGRSIKAVVGAVIGLALAGPAAAETTAPARHLEVAVAAAPDTPANRGYFAVARAEGMIALRHLAPAMDELQTARVHLRVRQALNAVDPGRHGAGPGLGYGMLAAIDRAADAIARAARSPEAREAVATASMPALAAAHTARQHLRHAIILGEQALAAPDLLRAKTAARAMHREITTALSGEDRDGDGAIAWDRGEAGLDQLVAQGTVMAAAAARVD